MTINMSKGDKVSFTKAEAAEGVKAENGWTGKRARNGNSLDYDLKGLILYRNGDQVYIGAANADELLVDRTGAVTHSGDEKGPGKLETISARWHADIDRIALSSYSALENGVGSFNEYGVFVRATAGTKVVEIPAEDANADAGVYTCLFAELVYNEDGTIDLLGAEEYSSGGEKRVAYVKSGGKFLGKGGDLKIQMDAGPRGQNK